MFRIPLLGILLAATAADPAALLQRADAPHDAFAEGTIRLRVSVVEGGKEPAEGTLDLFVKGDDRSLCVFRDGKQQGRRILTVGDKVWLIVPTASKPVPVSKSQRLMGAASFGDIAALKFSDTYEATLRPEPDQGDLVLDLAAKRKGAAYPRGVLAVGKEDGLPRRLRLSLASGKEAKDITFAGYDERSRLRAMEIRDLLSGKKGSVTTLTFERYEQRSLDPSIFDPEGARKVP